MKKIFSLIWCLAVGAVGTISAQGVRFEIGEGTLSQITKTRIEENLSNLLTEINRAGMAENETEKQLNLSTVKITEDAQKSLSMLWANAPFFCLEEEIVENVSQAGSNYQVRNIPLQLQRSTTDDVTIKEEDLYQEAVIEFDIRGCILSFYFTISNNLYRDVMKSGKDVADLRRRQQILDYVEHFRTAYNQKDIEFLNQTFSDDAIIITGKVTHRTKDGQIQPTVDYKTQDKKEYLTRLNGIFLRAKSIHVTFSEIKVTRHPNKADYYGVLVRQYYAAKYENKAQNYEDDGYVFLLWDFTNEEQPKIHVRTWQPTWMDESKTTKINEDDLFDIGDFQIDM